jgi:selenocysteine-specific elongation factor
MARVVILQSEDREPVGQVDPGETAMVQLRLEEPIAALPGDRFIIRSYSPQVTIGGGIILDAFPEKHRLRDRSAHRWLERLENAGITERIALIVEMAGPHGLNAPEIAFRTGATDAQIKDAARLLIQSRRLIEVHSAPLTLISRADFDILAASVKAVVAEHHRREPLALGVSREEVRDRSFSNLRPEIFRSVVTAMTEAGTIAAERDALRLASHRPALSDADTAAKQALETAVARVGWQALTMDEASAAAGIKIDSARKLFTLLLAEQKVVRVGDFVFSSGAIEDLKSRVRARKATSPRIDVTVFKELTGGLSRKHAIPLLEYLDRERITRRIGNEREIL